MMTIQDQAKKLTRARHLGDDGSVPNLDQATVTEMDDLLAKQKKELKELQSKLMALKKSAPKGDKKRKKEVCNS
jgi:hypothetical protein